MDQARRTARRDDRPEHSTYGLEADRPTPPASRGRPHPAPSGSGDRSAGSHRPQPFDTSDPQVRAVLDALPVAVCTTDARGVLTYANRAAAELVGRQPRIGVDRWCPTWRLYHPDGTPLPIEESPMAVALRENRPVRNAEVLVERPNGDLVPVLPFPTPITDAQGNLCGGVNTLIDVSERKRAEAGQLGLLRELSHRVKNNMQMLLSLLTSAARESESAQTRDVLTAASRRVAVIGAVQRVLYGSDGNGTTYRADALLSAVVAIAAASHGRAMTITRIDSGIVLANDTAVPLALILNELLSNASRHGVQHGEAPSAMVSLVRNGERFALTVEDRGPGFVPDFDRTKRASGLGLVRGLARQIGGTLSVERCHGARCTVTFSDRALR